uniref:uncharacterized protein LOC117160284 isoform X4 n=1 Tax=Bombus vancouverensis nearcticus TaxID=2705178 RepID=UPI000D08F855|nr:uncharacterized protein LOC117160284 isoform X4 [Bombus vancouverensis nearcticus]
MKVRGTQSSWLPPPVTPPLPSPPPRILLCFGARAGSPICIEELERVRNNSEQIAPY